MNKKYTIVAVGVLILGSIFIFGNRDYSSDNVTGLAMVKPTETVELKNGDIYDITASYVEKEINGVKYKMLAYNGSIPGPLIKVEQGSEVTINLKNNTDMGTLLHSHGIRMDNKFDGTPDVQKEIKPGYSFAYKLKFPDVGMYWYHPHVREDYQQELGLYGNFLVIPKDRDYWSPVNQEVPLFLDDILIENSQINISKNSADHTLMGRYGNVMLVNGSEDYSLKVKRGEVVRFYVTNSANARPFNFSIAGTKMKLVGGDSGAYEKETLVDGVILGPSERAIVEVLFENPGFYAIQNKTPDFTRDMGDIEVSGENIATSYANFFYKLKTHDEVVESIDEFRPFFNKSLDKEIKLSLGMGGGMQGMSGGSHMMPDGTIMGDSMMMSVSKDGIEWEDGMQATSGTDMANWNIVDQRTGKQNMDIDWKFKIGDKVKIRITNDAHSMHPMQHPIHFHGQRFLVLDSNGVSQTNLVWKDTVLVPAGQYVDILLDISNSGDWMAHCHIAEHLEAGMMFGFKVE